MHGVPFFLINRNLMSINICTWNSQGNPFNDSTKKAIFHEMYKANDVLLIQECGNIINNLGPEYNYLHGEQVGAGNCRCSLCIISKRSFVDISPTEITSASGRPALGIKVDNINIYTLHALSGNGIPDVMNIFRDAREPFVIGGDMNCRTSDICGQHGVPDTNYVFVGSHSRPQNVGELITSERITHPGSNAELDYFIFSLDLKSSHTQPYKNRGGDHYPVCTTVDWYGKDRAKTRLDSLNSFFKNNRG